MQGNDAWADGAARSDPSDAMETVTEEFLPEEDEEVLLQPGERTLVQLVARGIPDRQIAQQLGLSEIQVRDQLLTIFRKLAVAGLLDQLVYNGDQV